MADETQAPQVPAAEMKKKGLPMKLIIGIVVVVLLAGGYYLWQNSKTPEQRNAEEAKKVVAKVERLISLPEGETPTLATVTDPALLKDQPFFTKAEAGFQVLLYPVAQKAFLYDPKKNIIVEVATLNLAPEQQ